MSHKGAKSLMEIEKMAEGNSLLYVDQLVHEFESRGLFIKTLTMDDLKLDPERCGVAGSPTKVFKVESVVLSGGGREMVEPTKTGLGKLIDKLMDDHILG
jgi:electron transfer flavoprotein beta subunit